MKLFTMMLCVNHQNIDDPFKKHIKLHQKKITKDFLV